MRSRATRGSDFGALAVLLFAVLAWSWVAVPLATGRQTLSYRDVLSNHFAREAFGARELAAGRVPAVDPTWGSGQPFRGNPSVLAFYPDRVLYLALPFWSAFNLHFVLHWLLALISARQLARELGRSETAAAVAGVAYAGSGVVISGLTFYNLITVLAWWPLALAGIVRGGRRGFATASLAIGMSLLGGEPVTAALGSVPLLGVAIGLHGVRRGSGRALAALAAGALVALPQLVATGRVLGHTSRGAVGAQVAQAGGYALHPWRLLELLLPFPFGLPGRAAPEGFWALDLAPDLPFFLTLHCGVVVLWLALVGARRGRGWAALAVAGLALAIAGGHAGELLISATGGLFRYPEKLLLWPALALPALASGGWESLVGRRRSRLGSTLAATLAVVAVLALVGHFWSVPAVTAQLAARGESPAAAELLAAQLRLVGTSALVGALLLAAAVEGAARGRGVGVALLALASVAVNAPAIVRQPTAPLAAATHWLSRAGAGAAVLPVPLLDRRWAGEGPHLLAESVAAQRLLQARALGPAPGSLSGLRYPLAPDLEGLSSTGHALALELAAEQDWGGRLGWLRSRGVRFVTTEAEIGDSRYRLLDRLGASPTALRLYELPDPAPLAWWPRTLRVVDSVAALAAAMAEGDPVAAPVSLLPVEHSPRGAVTVTHETPDRIALEVDSDGGVLVVRRSFWSLYQATAGERRLETLPVDLDLLGVLVPPGRWTVVVSIPDTAEVAALLVSLLGLGGLGFLLLGPEAVPVPRLTPS